MQVVVVVLEVVLSYLLCWIKQKQSWEHIESEQRTSQKNKNK